MTAIPIAPASGTGAPPYLRRSAAENYLALPPGSLAKLACFGTGPRMRNLGRRVLYDVGDLDAWVAAHKVASAAEARTRAAR